jgi:hypothetical protein
MIDENLQNGPVPWRELDSVANLQTRHTAKRQLADPPPPALASQLRKKHALLHFFCAGFATIEVGRVNRDAASDRTRNTKGKSVSF